MSAAADLVETLDRVLVTLAPVLQQAKEAFFDVLEDHTGSEILTNLLWAWVITDALAFALNDPEVDPEGLAEVLNQQIAGTGWCLVRVQ